MVAVFQPGGTRSRNKVSDEALEIVEGKSMKKAMAKKKVPPPKQSKSPQNKELSDAKKKMRKESRRFAKETQGITKTDMRKMISKMRRFVLPRPGYWKASDVHRRFGEAYKRMFFGCNNIIQMDWHHFMTPAMREKYFTE